MGANVMENKLQEFGKLFFECYDEYYALKGIDMLEFFGRQIDRGYSLPLDFMILEFLAGQIEDGFINQLEEYPVLLVAGSDTDKKSLNKGLNYLMDMIEVNAKIKSADNDLKPHEYLKVVSKDLMENGLRIILFTLGEDTYCYTIVSNDNAKKVVEIYNEVAESEDIKSRVL